MPVARQQREEQVTKDTCLKGQEQGDIIWCERVGRFSGCTNRVMILCDGAVDSHRKE